MSLEKRLLVVGLMIIISAIFATNYKTNSGSVQAESSVFRNSAYDDAASKLKDGSGWQTHGWGSGEYLETIPTIKAGAVVDMDSGEVIWSQNIDERIAPASLTKIATVMTALDIADLDKVLYVSDSASSQIPTKLELASGERLTLNEAISAAVMTSANDATEAISDSLGKEVGEGTFTFMKLVNLKAQKIGALNSNFVTSTGLDDKLHYSTIRDLVLIGREAFYDYPKIRELGGLSYRNLAASSFHKNYDLPNWNALLGTYPGVNGMKIGFTEEAGHTTMVTASRGGKNLIVVLVGAKSLEGRETAAATLLNYGFVKSGIEPYAISNLDLKGRFEDWRRQLTQGGP